MIDVHAHLNDDKLYPIVDKVVFDAKNSGVNIVVCSSYDLDSSIKAVEIANKYDCVFANVGMHPHDSKFLDEKMLEKFKNLCENKKVVGFGEIGLDYHYDLSPRQIQKQAFESQIKLAHSLSLPIVVHMREATEDTINILKSNKEYLKKGGLIHCFSGSYETFKTLYDMGFIFSFGGAITFKNAKNELLPKIPSDSYVFETDCPYMTPVPYRGHTNKPEYVGLVYKKACEILNVDETTLKQRARENYKRIFKI